MPEPLEPFKLLQLPVDVLAYLCRRHLSPTSAVALALTCKALYQLRSTLAVLPLEDCDVGLLCQLLERDAAHKYYYCIVCRILHPFWPSEGPTFEHSAPNLPERHCYRYRWSLRGSGFILGLRHLRLAMNRHLFGSCSGISLERFRLTNFSLSRPCWHERWSAKIIDGDLFLSSTRTLRCNLRPHELHRAVAQSSYDLCTHEPLHMYLSPSDRRDVLGHCKLCFTDFTVTAERGGPAIQSGTADEYWDWTVVTYHRFPTMRSSASPSSSELDPRFQYDTEIHPMYRPAGLIRDIWLGVASRTARAGKWVCARLSPSPS